MTVPTKHPLHLDDMARWMVRLVSLCRQVGNLRCRRDNTTMGAAWGMASGDRTAVDHQHLPGDERRQIGAEERGGGADVLGPAQAA